MALMTLAEYARHRGVSKPAVTKAVQSGRIPVVQVGDKRMVDSDVADQAWAKNSASEKKTGPTQREKLEEGSQPAPATESEPKAATGATYTASRAIKEHFNARLAKLQFEEKSGKLIGAEDIQEAAFKVARATRDALLALPDRLAAELAAENNQFNVHKRLTEEIRKALIGLKDGI